MYRLYVLKSTSEKYFELGSEVFDIEITYNKLVCSINYLHSNFKKSFANDEMCRNDKLTQFESCPH